MRQFITLSLLSLAIAFTFAAPAMADGKIGWKGSGSGDWNGQRTHLDELGLTFIWIQGFSAQQNVSGGVSRGGAAHARSVLQANYQFEPLTPLKGSEIQVSTGWHAGGNIQDNVGSLLSPAGIWRAPSIRLYELYWGQFFWDKQIHFKIGRMGLCPWEAAQTQFWVTGDLSNGYYCNPGGLYLNQPTSTIVFDIATWGARIKIAPEKQDFQFWFGAYNGSQSGTLANADEHGVDFKMNLRESTYMQGEFWYKLNQDPEDEGLPGNYKIGGMNDTGSFSRLDDSTQTRRGNPGWYLIFDQMLFRERPSGMPKDRAKFKGGWKTRSTGSSPPTAGIPADEGLYVTANFVHNPRTAFNIAPYWVSAGLNYKGAIPHRDADMMSFAFYYGSLSQDSALDYEFQLRYFYSLQLTQWIFMSPNVQYFKKPGGGQVPHAVVLGVFFHMTL
jgi:porin